MEVDAKQFLKDGYLILRQAVAPERLDHMRLLVELMVDKSKAMSVAERTADDPLGGAWYAGGQPRVEVPVVVDEGTAEFVDFCLEENTMGVSRKILQESRCVLSGIQVMCSPIIDFGHTDWHRDSSAITQAPLFGLAQDLLENKTGYVQWNIALYDDDVFWLLPGSHARATTEAERRQLLLDPTAALPDGMCVDLKAGDAVVYCNLSMHWGSYYSSKIRRTIHLSYRAFDSDIFPYSYQVGWANDLEFARHLSAAARSHFEQAAQWYAEELDVIGGTLRGIVDNDPAAFRDKLAELHRGEKHRMVAVVLLCRMMDEIYRLKTEETAVSPKAPGVSPRVGYLYSDLSARFTMEEIDILHHRFAPLNELLQAGYDKVQEHYTNVYAELRPDAEPPSFESRPLRHFYTNMPENFGVDEFIASWNDGVG